MDSVPKKEEPARIRSLRVRDEHAIMGTLYTQQEI